VINDFDWDLDKLAAYSAIDYFYVGSNVGSHVKMSIKMWDVSLSKECPFIVFLQTVI
jgi:hypothetical protein